MKDRAIVRPKVFENWFKRAGSYNQLVKPEILDGSNGTSRVASIPRQPWVLVSLAWLVLCVALGMYPSGREFALAQQDKQAGRIKEAAAHLARAAGGRPWHTGWWEESGRLAFQCGDLPKAIEWLETGRKRDGLSGEGLTTLGDAYLRSGNLAEALKTWDTAELQGTPEDDLAERRLEVHRALDDWDGITRDLLILSNQQPEDAQLRYELGLVLSAREPRDALAYLLQAGELDASLKTSTDLLVGAIRNAQDAHDQAYSLLNIGRTLASLSEWELAVEAFHLAVLARPDYAEAWAFLGEARQHLGEDHPGQNTPLGCGDHRKTVDSVTIDSGRITTDQAREDLERAILLDPESLSAQLFLSIYWQRRNCPARALEAIQTAARLAPENPAIQVELGNTRAAAGDLPGGQEAYQRAVSLAPGDPLYWRELATFTLKNEFQVRQVGLPAAGRAIQLAPQDPAGFDVMAQVLLRLNDPWEARRFLVRALEIQPGYAPAWLHLGWINFLEGDRQEASQQFQKVIALDPGSPAAEQARRSLENYFR